MTSFQRGNLKNFTSSWCTLTTDSEVLNTASGLPLEFGVPLTNRHSDATLQGHFSPQVDKFIAHELERLLSKNIIKKSQHEQAEFISPIFLTPKSDGSFRFILNLKRLNEHIPYVHFKMSTIGSVLNLITKDCYMAKIDIKDAYYSVPILYKHQKYLKFYFKGQLYQFMCLPNGLSSGPRKFTKLLKPPLATLMHDKAVVSAYIDN